MTFTGRRDVEAARGDSVAQTAASQKLRVIRTIYFTAATGDAIAVILRDWFVAAEDTVSVAGVPTIRKLNSEREIIDMQYRVDAGVHHILLLYTQ